jgi:hypothetical protein
MTNIALQWYASPLERLALLTLNSTRGDLPCTNMEGRQYDRQLCVNFIDRILRWTYIPSHP